MKNLNKKYKYEFSKTFYIIAIIGTIVALGCIILNAVRFFNFVSKNIEPTFYEYLSLILSVVLSILFMVFIISAIINSYYTINKSQVIVTFGILKNKINASEIKEIKLLPKLNKLELTFLDDTYFIVSILPKLHEEFIDELKKNFPQIPFIQISEEN